jgi:hypothetical protein
MEVIFRPIYSVNGGILGFAERVLEFAGIRVFFPLEKHFPVIV